MKNIAAIIFGNAPFCGCAECRSSTWTGRSFPAALSRIHYTFYDSLADVEAWLAAHDDRLQCVVSQCVRHSRRVAFGRAQHPGLTDYADDVDTMRFLGTI